MFFASVAAGLISYPLDTIRVCLSSQVENGNDKKYNGSIECAKNIYKN